MSKIGIHSLVFGDTWTEETAQRATGIAAEIGYDLFEVLIFDPEALDTGMTGQVVKDAGLELRLGMALSQGADISSTNPEIAKAGEATVARCLEIASDLRVPAVSGITYAAFNNYTAPPTNAQRAAVMAALARLDKLAGNLGVKLGLEPVNRYESNMINSLDQAGDMIRSIGAANMFIHMDTFHMNIEEADLPSVISRNADLLGYAHVAENHRGLLGTGNFDWSVYFRALADVGYSGDFTVESFSSEVLGPDLVGGVSLWRKGWLDAKDAATSAHAVVKSLMQTAELSVSPWNK